MVNRRGIQYEITDTQTGEILSRHRTLLSLSCHGEFEGKR